MALSWKSPRISLQSCIVKRLGGEWTCDLCEHLAFPCSFLLLFIEVIITFTEIFDIFFLLCVLAYLFYFPMMIFFPVDSYCFSIQRRLFSISFSVARYPFSVCLSEEFFMSPSILNGRMGRISQVADFSLYDFKYIFPAVLQRSQLIELWGLPCN